MSTHNIAFSILNKKSPKIEINPNLQLWDFFQEIQERFRNSRKNKPSVFDPLKFYCTSNIMPKSSQHSLKHGVE